ncbi:MAG TPA: hypothetical protein VFI29_13455 [Hanamia sp.]|nr:hypothetical protein [Hanamia sp.]
MKKGIFILSLIICACNNVNEVKKHVIEKKSTMESNGIIQKKQETTNPDTLNRVQNQESKVYNLLLNNDSLNQEMKVQYNGKKKIIFTLITFNKLRNQRDSLIGIATRDQDKLSDEYDQAEDGTAFLYYTWHFTSSKCQLEMRIADSAKFIRIFEFNCNGLHKQSCPFETNGVLERIDMMK